MREQRERHADDREPLAAGRVVDAGDVLGQLVGVQERGHRTASLVSLSIMTAMPTPQLGWQPQLNWPQSWSGPWTRSAQSEKVRHEGDREPVAGRLAEAGLVLDVVRQVRQRVALGVAALVGDGLVAAGEGDRLEGEEGDLLGVVERELDDAADLLVVDAVDDGDDGDDVDAGLVQVLDGLQLHVEQVADLAVRVGGVADAVELQVGVAQTGLSGGLGRTPWILANSMPLVAACTVL